MNKGKVRCGGMSSYSECFEGVKTTSEDITKISADVLIISVGAGGMLTRVENSLENREKHDSLFRILRLTRVNTEDVAAYRVEEGGNLPYKHIIYVSDSFIRRIFPRIDMGEMQRILRKTVNQVLKVADVELKAQSVVIGGRFTLDRDYTEACEMGIAATVKSYLRLENPYLDITVALLPDTNTQSEAQAEEVGAEKPLDTRIYAEYEKRLNEKIRLSGKSRADYFQSVRCDYMLRYEGTVEEFAEAVGSNKSTVCRIRSGQTRKPNKSLVLAMGLVLGLSPEDFYIFVHANNRKYPEDARDNFIENAIRYGDMTYDEIRETVGILDPDNPLTAYLL
jgi:hypothetical protein